jgi:hypothetical protein
MRILRRPRGPAALFLVCGLAVALALSAHAQDSGEGQGDQREVTSSGSASAGLNGPLPAGYSVLYMFSGVANRTSGTTRIATSVHCTNYGSSPVDTRVEMYDYNAGNVWWDQNDIGPGSTRTFSSQTTNIFFDDEDLEAGMIDQGAGRVLADRSSLICTVHLVDPDSDQPSFMDKLALYYADGTQVNVHGMNAVLLPVILRHSPD